MNPNLIKISQSSVDILRQFEFEMTRIVSINGITKIIAKFEESFIKIVISEEELWFAVITYGPFEESQQEFSYYSGFLAQINAVLPLGGCMILDKREKGSNKFTKNFFYRTYQKCNDEEGIDKLIQEHIEIHIKVFGIVCPEIGKISEGSMSNIIETLKNNGLGED